MKGRKRPKLSRRETLLSRVDCGVGQNWK